MIAERESGRGTIVTERQENEKSKPPIAALVIGAAVVAVLYFGFPCHRYLSDGLLAAIQMRDSADWYIHPNHPIYPLLPQIIHRLAIGAGGGIDEMELLLIWSMSMGVIACWGMILALKSGKMSVAAILIGLAFFALIKGVWYFSVIPSPGSTALGTLVPALAAIVLMMYSFQKNDREKPAPSTLKITVIGLLISLAILASQINAVLILPAGYAILQDKIPTRSKIRHLIWLLGIIIITTIGAMFLGGYIFAGIRNPTEFINWQHSYVYQGRWFVSGLVDAIQRNWIGLNDLMVAYVFRGDGLFGDWSEELGTLEWYKRLAVRAGQAIVLIFFLFETIRAIILWIRTRKLHPLQVIGITAALPVFLFSCIWTPETIHYRILYIPGSILFLVPSLEKYYRLDRFSFRRAWPLLLVIVCLFGVNFYNQFLPQSNPVNNYNLLEVWGLEEQGIGPGDLIIYAGTGDGGMRERYVRYFLQCDSFRVHELMPKLEAYPELVIEDFLERHERGSTMLIHEDALFSDESLELMNEQYDLDVKPDELMEFMESWAVPVSRFRILRKEYIRFVPKENAASH